MAPEGEGIFNNYPPKTKGKKYDKFSIYIPTEVARDSHFPFKLRDRVKVRIVGASLIIEPIEKTG